MLQAGPGAHPPQSRMAASATTRAVVAMAAIPRSERLDTRDDTRTETVRLPFRENGTRGDCRFATGGLPRCPLGTADVLPLWRLPMRSAAEAVPALGHPDKAEGPHCRRTAAGVWPARRPDRATRPTRSRLCPVRFGTGAQVGARRAGVCTGVVMPPFAWPFGGAAVKSRLSRVCHFVPHRSRYPASACGERRSIRGGTGVTISPLPRCRPGSTVAVVRSGALC